MQKILLQRAAAGALLFGFGILVRPLPAQAPAITTAGDPTVRADTIYRLAIPASQAGGRETVTLFDDRIVRVESDFRTSTTERRIWQQIEPLDPKYGRGWSFAVTQPGDGQQVRLNWLRILRRDGSLVAQASPADLKPERSAEFIEWNLDFQRPDSGQIVDYSYTTTETARPKFPEFFAEFGPERTRRARTVIDVPASMRLRISERYLATPRTETTVAGRRTYTWTARELGPRISSYSKEEDRLKALEPYAPDSLTRHPHVVVSSERTWKQVGDEFRASIPRNAFAFDKGAMKEFDDDTYLHLARSYLDTLSTVHGWLSMDYELDFDMNEYGVALGRDANRLARDSTGSQEELVMLFIAAARAHGIRAYPVLIGAYSTDSLHPARGQLTHLGAWVETKNPQLPWLYRDPSTSQSFFRSDYPEAQQGQFGIVIFDDSVKHITLPRSKPGNNVVLTTLTGTLAADGSVAGRMRYEARGTKGYELNRELELAYADKRSTLGRDVVTSLYPNTRYDSLSWIGPWMQEPNPYITAPVRIPAVGTRQGSTFTLDLFWKPISGLDSMVNFLERTPRRMPIDAEKVVGNSGWLNAISLKLPAGWKARLPQAVTAESPFGTFKTTYEQKGDVLTVSQLLVGAQGVLGPEKAKELAQWLRTVQGDRTTRIVIDVR